MYQKGSIGYMHLPQAKMPDPRAAKGRCQCSCRTRSVLQEEHMCSFGPFRPTFSIVDPCGLQATGRKQETMGNCLLNTPETVAGQAAPPLIRPLQYDAS